MNRLLLLVTGLLLTATLHAQLNYLFVKKGWKKVRTYTEGDHIHFRLADGHSVSGRITMLRNDSIFVNGHPVSRPEIAMLILDKKSPKFPASLKTLLLTGGGVILTGIGLSLNNQNSPEKAFIIAAVIGYGPLIAKYIFNQLLWVLTRKKYKLGKKYRLQVLDFYLPRSRGF